VANAKIMMPIIKMKILLYLHKKHDILEGVDGKEVERGQSLLTPTLA
jgi:hypothetical protein